MRKFKWISGVIVLALLLVPVPVSAAAVAALVKQGNAAYAAGKFDAALDAYAKAAAECPKSARIYFNKGAAYFRKDDLRKAKAAWEKAALNAADLSLKAKALYNLGNLSFSEAKRQKDADLQKSIAACTRSVRYYQKAIDLLKKPATPPNPTLRQQAAENIEMVRLTLKSILDELHKRKDRQAQQQAAADQIQKLIDKQQALNKRRQNNRAAEQKNGASKQLQKAIADLADDQQKLSTETRAAAQALPNHPQSDALEKARQNMGHAGEEQRKAAERMQRGDLAGAAQQQQSALEELEKARNALARQHRSGPGKRPQAGQGRKAAESGGKNQDPEKAARRQKGTPSAGTPQKDQQAAAPVVQMPDDAQSILNAESENRKYRRQSMPAGYADIDKDW